MEFRAFVRSLSIKPKSREPGVLGILTLELDENPAAMGVIAHWVGQTVRLDIQPLQLAFELEPNREEEGRPAEKIQTAK